MQKLEGGMGKHRALRATHALRYKVSKHRKAAVRAPITNCQVAGAKINCKAAWGKAVRWHEGEL
jgi:hypothetical protein